MNLSVAAVAQQNNKKAKVMDFEADVIEGEKKSPSLFLEFQMEKADLESLLYMRTDFNDFHSAEMKKKLKYQNGNK
jgi:hypothetical protein